MTVKTFRKKPVEIQAVQWTGSNEGEVQELAADFFYRIDDEDRPHTNDPEATGQVFDKLHSTWVLVYDGDWIIRGVQGEFYPIRPDVLANTYDWVSG